MIKIIMRDGSERFFDAIDRRQIHKGILVFAGIGGCEVSMPTSLIAEVHLRTRTYAVVAE